MANAVTTSIVKRLIPSCKSAVPKFVGKHAFHSSGPKQMADHGASGGGSLYTNDYLHAPHMYNIRGMKNRHVKMGIMVFGGLALGTYLPIFCVQYQGKKLAGY